MAYHVFISYRRDNGGIMARLLYERLKADGYEPFFDIEQMHNGVFDEQLYKRIEEADDFILILSKNALDRCSNENDWVRLEIQRALELNKNIVPFMMKDFSFPQSLPDELADISRHHAISESSDYFDACYAKLKSMLRFRPSVKYSVDKNIVYLSDVVHSRQSAVPSGLKKNRAILSASALNSISCSGIQTITFTDSLDNAGDDSTDISECGSDPILLWTQPIEDEKLELYIGSNSLICFPKDSSYLFASFPDLIEINFNNVCDTSHVTDMHKMFFDCPQLSELDLSDFDTSFVEDMSYMFAVCSSLTQLDLSSFDTSCVTNMTGMFSFCSSLTQLDLSSFDTSCVQYMIGMFAECTSLTELDISSFNTQRVTSMVKMFSKCSSLTELDLTSFDTLRVRDMSFMFENCYSLQSLFISSAFVVCLPARSMIRNCGTRVAILAPSHITKPICPPWLARFLSIHNFLTFLGLEFSDSL